MKEPTVIKKMEAIQKITDKFKAVFPNGCQRILLIEPPNVPEEDYSIDVAWDNRYPVYPPMGLAILKTDLKNRGYEVEILDLNFMLQEHLKSNRGNFRYSIWQDWLSTKIEQFVPQVVGLTCMFSIYHRQMVKIAKFISDHSSKIVIFAGGVNVTTAAELVLQNCPDIHFIGLYEGNGSFGDILDFVNNRAGREKVTQIAALINGEYVARNERALITEKSLNLIPDFEGLSVDKYSSVGRIGNFYWLLEPAIRIATGLANRGCRGRCRFCSVRYFNGQGVRTREITVILDELEMLRDRFGIGHIMWLDDDLFFNSKRTVALFNGMVKRNLNMTWDASNGIIASALTEEVADASEKSGCIGLNFGIESGNPEVLRHIRKPSGIKHFYRAAEIMKKHPKIFTKGFLMVGFIPELEKGFAGENTGMIRDTIKLARDIKFDWYTISPLNLIPGTEITNHALVQGLIKGRELIDGTEKPHIGSTGSQIRRTEDEKNQAQEFDNLLSRDSNIVPSREEIPDIWFVMDYLVNYEKIQTEDRQIKLEMLQKLFVNMCDKTHKENALGNLFFAILESKLDRIQNARERLALAQKYYEESDYWHKRFKVLGLNQLLFDTEKNISMQ